MTTHYLIIARKTPKSDTTIIDKLVFDLSAKQDAESEVGWVFKSEDTKKTLRAIHPKLNSKFSYCLIVAPKFKKDFPYHRSNDAHIDVIADKLKREDGAGMETLLNRISTYLANQEIRILKKERSKNKEI